MKEMKGVPKVSTLRFWIYSLGITGMLLGAFAALSAPGDFVPDTTFKGSSLTGWHPLGQANWKAQNGEITGTVNAGGTGGWLVSDQSLQDLQLYTSFRCTDGCKTGVLLRAEKTPAGGMKGVYVSLNEGDLASYRVTLDAQGQELTREKLKAGGGETRYASVGSNLTPGMSASQADNVAGAAAQAGGGAGG